MLERAPGCLEHPLRRLFRGPKTCLRSRRMLHSAFWSHGGGEIDSASWWTQFLSTSRGTLVHDANSRAGRYSSYNSSEWPFLDFLYPSQTLAFLQRCSSYGINALLPRRRKVTSRSGLRAYTSTAELELQPGEETTNLHSVESLLERLEEISETPPDLFKELLDTCGSRDEHFDLIWHAFQNLKDPRGFRSKAVAFLSYSTRQIDFDRITSLTAAQCERRRLNARSHLEKFTRLGNIDGAFERLCTVLVNADRSSQSTLILSQSIARQDWIFAGRLWKEYETDGPQCVNWAEVDGLHVLPRRLLNLFAFIKREVAGYPDSRLGNVRNLARRLALRVFQHRGLMNELREGDMFKLFRALRSNNILTRGHYILAIVHSLKSNREIGISESLYWEMSQCNEFGPPPRFLLGALLSAFCKINSYWGINKILKDFTEFYRGPDEKAMQLLMTTYARLGDEKLVNRTFDEYCSRFGTPRNFEFITPLIYVHARVGNVQKATAQFNRIEKEFKMKPNVVCWNILIMACARVGDLEGAFEKFRELLVHDVEPDAYTFGTLMGMLANRGDTEGVDYLINMAREKNLRLTTALIDAQVEVLCRNGEVYEAIDLLKSAVHMDLIGSKTRMWNVLLHTFASQKDVMRTLQTQNRMKLYNIPFDDMTYAALMGCLVQIGRTDSALQLMTEVMPREGYLPREFHYALVLRGFAKEGNRDMVHIVYRELLKLYKKGSFSANLAVIITAIKRDLSKNPAESPRPEEFALPSAEKFLRQTLDSLDTTTLASKDPQPGTYGQPLSESYPSAYFDPMVVALGTRGAFRKISDLFDEYSKRRRDQPMFGESFPPPLRLISALMVSYLRHGQHDRVTELWDLAFSKASRLARQIDVAQAVDSAPPPPVPNYPSLLVLGKAPKGSFDNPNKILPSQRFILSVPLRHYMNSLAARARYDEISSTIASVQNAGFALSTKNWNGYIQILASSSSVKDHFSAFSLCESLLIANFPSNWRMMTAGYGTDPFKREGFWTKQDEKRVDEKLYPGHLQPTYLTLVYLGAAFLKFRERMPIDGGREIERLNKQAPRTTAILSVMPRMKDALQGVFLRGLSRDPALDTPPRGGEPKRYPVLRDITPLPVKPARSCHRRRFRRTKEPKQLQPITEDEQPDALV